MRAVNAGLSDSSEANHAASQQLKIALHAANLRRTHLSTWDEDCAVEVLVFLSLPHSGVVSGSIAPSPIPHSAPALEALLRQKSIEATVSVDHSLEPDVGLRIALRHAHDATALADLILTNLSEPQAAAQRLRTVLAAAEIDAKNTDADGDSVSIGHITASEAITLGEILLSDSWPEELDLNHWTDLERLAQGLAKVLTTITGRCVLVDADPRCSRCCGDHEVIIGPLDPQQANRLADVVAATTCPVTVEPPGEISVPHQHHQEALYVRHPPVPRRAEDPHPDGAG